MPACRNIELSSRQYSPPTMPPVGCAIVPPEYGTRAPALINA